MQKAEMGANCILIMPLDLLELWPRRIIGQLRETLLAFLSPLQ